MASKPKQGKIRNLCKKGKYEALLRAITREELRQGFEPDLSQPIHYFAARGDLQAVRELVETYKCNPECQNVHGITPLHCASYCGRLPVVKSLVEEHKCDANERDKEGACPLACASYCVMGDVTLKCPLDEFQKHNKPRSEHIETAKFLLSVSTLQKASLADDLCILRLPVYCGFCDDFKQLVSTLNLKLGDNSPELGSEVAKCLEIALSCEESKSEFVQSLLCTYAKYIKIAMEKSDATQLTPNLFHKACSKADINVIKIFVELGICKPDVQSVKIAIDRKDYELVQFLLQSADHPLLLDRYYTDFYTWFSLLSYIFHELMNDKILIKLVFDSTLGRDIRDSEGNTPLHLVCKHFWTSDYLPGIIAERYSCYQFVLNNNNELPVHIACNGENLELIKAVSSQLQGKDINTQDRVHGNTPLHVMCKCPLSTYYSYHERLKYFILEKKCDLNIQNNLGELPIHIFLKRENKYRYYYDSDSQDSDQINSDRINSDQSDSDQIDRDQSDGDPVSDSDQIDKDQSDGDPVSDSDDNDQIELITSGQFCKINAQDSDGNTPLHLACKNDESSTVLYLVSEFKCDLNMSNNEGCIPLHYALSSNLALEAIKAVSSGCTIKCKQNNVGKTPLHIACENMQYLNNVKRKVLVNLVWDEECICVQDNEGNTPLHIACQRRSVVTALYLIQKYHTEFTDFSNVISLEAEKTILSDCTMKCKQNNTGQTPLHIICTNMQFLRQDKRMLLLNLISDETVINVQDNDGNTPLHIACKQHDLETAVYLTSRYQCDLDLVNNDHCLALHYAVSSYFNKPYSLDFVKVVCGTTLLHMLNSKGMTPLHIACENGNLDVVKYLVFEKNCFPTCYEASSDIYDSLEIHLACKDKSDIDLLKALANECNVNNDKSYNKTTPLHVACTNNNILAVKALLELKCNVLCKDSQGRLPVHIACSKSLECVIEMLPYITNDVVNNCENNGNTPLHIALKNNQLDIVNLLLSNFQCNFNITNSEREFPLHLVCSTTVSVVRIIFEKSTAQSIYINCQTQQDNTPLHIACQFGALDIVKFLTESFDCEPSMTLRNNEGKLPVDYACEHSLEMVKLVSQPCTVKDLVYLHQLIVSSFSGVSNKYKHKQKLSTLNFACKLGCLDIVMYLIKEKGCTLSALNNSHSALAYACGLKVSPYDQSEDNPNLNINIVKFLIEECGYNPGKTVYGTSLFQYSCQIDSLQLMNAVPIHQLDSQDSEGNTPLHYACKYDSVDIVKYLVDCGCNQNTVNKNGDSPLHMACRSSLEVTKLLTNYDVNLKNADGYTTLHIACESKKRDIALYLIEGTNCDVKVKNNEGEYPLHIASLKTMQVGKLVDKSDINCQDNYGDTPLHNACYLQNSDMIQFLLSYQECRADILNDDGDLALHMFLDSITISQISYQSPRKFSLKKVHYYRQHNISNLAQMVELILKRSSAAALATNHDGRTPIELAIMNGELEVIEVLLSVGEVDEVTQKILLHTACAHGQPEIVQWLISQGASTEIADDDDDYPPHVCLKQSDYNCLETLTQLGPVDVCKQDKNNDTILHLACRKEFEADILLKYILQTLDNCKKAFSMHNMNKDTPLHVLATYRYFISPDVLILIECDNPNLQDMSGNTPLHLACQYGKYKLAEHLITNCKCDPNVTNDNGELPLHIAVAQSQMEIIEVLARYEINITKNGNSPLQVNASQKANLEVTNSPSHLHSHLNTPNNQGNTPLHVAVTKSLEVVKLVATSDNTNMQNHNGDTPLHIACYGENMNIVNYLLKELKCSVELLNKNFESAFHILFNNWHYTQHSHYCSSELQKSLLYYIPQQLNDVSSKTGDTILQIACNKADHDVAIYFVETLKCKVDVVNEHSGATALHFACNRRSDSLSVVKLVTQCDPTAQIRDVSYLPKEVGFVSGDTPLHVACRKGNIDVIRHLLESGHSQALDYLNDLKELPIHLAVAACRSYPLIQVFISHKNNFDCNATNINGDAPLHIICRHKPSTASVKRMLHKLKCKVDVQNNEGNFPLHVLCQNKLICKGVAKVLSIGLDDDQIKHRNQNGNTALHEFLRFSHDTTSSSHHFKSLLQIFIDRGLLLLETVDGQVLDYLHLACHYQKLDIVKYLFEKYISVLQEISITLLHEACLNCNNSVLEYMLKQFEHAFDINIPNTNGDLPLHMAARMKVCKESTLTLLVKKTQDINHENNQGETPLHALYSGDKTYRTLVFY